MILNIACSSAFTICQCLQLIVLSEIKDKLNLSERVFSYSHNVSVCFVSLVFLSDFSIFFCRRRWVGGWVCIVDEFFFLVQANSKQEKQHFYATLFSCQRRALSTRQQFVSCVLCFVHFSRVCEINSTDDCSMTS